MKIMHTVAPKNQVKIIISAVVIVLLACVTACNDSNDPTQDTFDRTALLTHFADDLIIPSFTEVQQTVATLSESVDAFNADPTEVTLAAIKSAWENAYTEWQYANPYNFGPAGAEGIKKTLVEEIATFPVSETKINTNISSGSTTMTDNNRDARGFLAIEFLIYGQDASSTITAFNESANRRNYLKALVSHIKGKTDEVLTSWETSYRTTFIGNNATDAGSSSSLLYNEFVRSYEVLKNFKVALPMGLQANQTNPDPKLVEAYYSGTSLAMLKTNFTALENIWYGKSQDGVDGIGFKEYLENVEGGSALITSTEAQLAAVHTAFAKIPGTPSLSMQIETGNADLIVLSDELQKLTHYIKGDMSSLIGIAITFSSNDGD